MFTFLRRAKPRHVACTSYFTAANSTKDWWATQSTSTPATINGQPRTKSSCSIHRRSTTLPLNPNGCWDWWGLNDLLPRNREFTRKDGYQIAAIKIMLDRLAGGPAHSGGSSGTFGMPQNFSVADSTSSSIALIWQPNSAATGFNVYRSPSSAGPYAKINSRPVAGASFADQGLTANTAYYYKISAVDGSGQESALAGPVHENTAPTPPACDPYYSDNVTHWNKHRADRVGVTKVKAHGSGDPMGRLDPDVSKQLIQVQPDFYRARYCP